MKASARFTIAIGRAPGTVVVTVHGHLDLVSAQHLETVLGDLSQGQDGVALIVDLHDARADDPAALMVFGRAAAQARARAGTLVLSRPPDAMDAGLEAAGLARLVSHGGTRRSYAIDSSGSHDRSVRGDGDHDDGGDWDPWDRGHRSDHPAGGGRSGPTSTVWGPGRS